MSLLMYLKKMKDNTTLDYNELKHYLYQYGAILEEKFTLEFSKLNIIMSIREFINEINICCIEKVSNGTLKVSTTSISILEEKFTLEFSKLNIIMSIREFINEINICCIEKVSNGTLKVSTTSIYPNTTAKIIIERYNSDYILIERINNFYVKDRKEISDLISMIQDEHLYCDRIIVGKKRFRNY